MDAKTCWVSRGMRSDSLVLWPVPPKWDDYVEWDASNGSDVWADHYWTLGLPSEPAPGSCWEVRWEPWTVLDELGSTLIPIARDVTEELKGGAP